jgi:hypothetical protein
MKQSDVLLLAMCQTQVRETRGRQKCRAAITVVIAETPDSTLSYWYLVPGKTALVGGYYYMSFPTQLQVPTASRHEVPGRITPPLEIYSWEQPYVAP